MHFKRPFITTMINHSLPTGNRGRNPVLAEDTYRGEERGEPLIQENHRPKYVPFVQTYIFPEKKQSSTEIKHLTPIPVADQLLDQLDQRMLLEKKRLIENDMRQLQVR